MVLSWFSPFVIHSLLFTGISFLLLKCSFFKNMKENVCLLLHAHVCSVCGLLIIILKEIVKIVIFILLEIVYTSLERFQDSSLCNVWSYVFIILLKLEFGRKITVPYVCPNGQTYAGVTDNAWHCRQNILDGLSLGMFVFMVVGWDGSRRRLLDRGCQVILKICQDWVFDEAKGCWHSKANLSLWLLELSGDTLDFCPFSCLAFSGAGLSPLWSHGPARSLSDPEWDLHISHFALGLWVGPCRWNECGAGAVFGQRHVVGAVTPARRFRIQNGKFGNSLDIL